MTSSPTTPMIVANPFASSFAGTEPLDVPPLELPPELLVSPLDELDVFPLLEPPLLDAFVSPPVPSPSGFVPLDSEPPHATAVNETPTARIPPTYSERRIRPPQEGGGLLQPQRSRT